VITASHHGTNGKANSGMIDFQNLIAGRLKSKKHETSSALCHGQRVYDFFQQTIKPLTISK
jgi:hypothetical protein